MPRRVWLTPIQLQELCRTDLFTEEEKAYIQTFTFGCRPADIPRRHCQQIEREIITTYSMTDEEILRYWERLKFAYSIVDEVQKRMTDAIVNAAAEVYRTDNEKS